MRGARTLRGYVCARSRAVVRRIERGVARGARAIATSGENLRRSRAPAFWTRSLSRDRR